MLAKVIGIAAAVAALGLGTNAVVRGDTAHISSHAHRVTLTKVWTAHIAPIADSAGAYITRTPLRAGPLLYVLAGNNGSNCDPGDPVRKATLYAFNARTGVIRWHRSTAGPARCTTAGPVADPSGRWVYAPGLDGKLHRYDSTSGRETIGSGWPITYSLMPQVEKASATATIHGNHLYLTTSGYIGDAGHYEGHLLTVNLVNAQVKVFNSLCSNVTTLLGPTSGKPNYCAEERSAFFGRGEGVVDPVSHDVYVVSGNGAWNGKTDWGDSVLKLDPSGSRLLDSYTPRNQQELNDQDLDLGSTGPAMLPPLQRDGRTYYLLTQSGKGPACGTCSGTAIRLLNRNDLSGKHGIGHLGGDLSDVQAPGGCEVLTAPAPWKSPSGTPWVFYANSCGVAAYRVAGSGTQFRLERVWTNSTGGTTPILYQGVLYVAVSGHVTAYDPATGSILTRVSGIGTLHWEYPLVTAHHLFITDGAGTVTCFSIR